MRIPTLKTVAALIAAVALLPTCLPASGAAGVVAAPYLKLPMGARSTGMGEAFTGLADDTSALYYNPAGLTQIESTMANFMHIQGFSGINYEYVSLVSPAANIGLDVTYSGTVTAARSMVRSPNCAFPEARSLATVRRRPISRNNCPPEMSTTR